MVCIRCQKRPAIIFIQRMVDGQMKQEGYCLHCARELHIKPCLLYTSDAADD